jgi:transposase InsO family protein
MEVLSRLISERGQPKALRSDNGPEFISNKLKAWAAALQLPLERVRQCRHKIFAHKAMHLIWTAAKNEAVFFA